MSDADEVLVITRQMLDAMYTADPEVHRRHCTEDMSSFEWYIAPYRIDGLEFHLDLIRAGGQRDADPPGHADAARPGVRGHGHRQLYAAEDDGGGETARTQFSRMNETRVFVRQDNTWKMAHLHKSPAGIRPPAR